MYLVAIHVPIYQHRGTRLLETDWLRSLELLRDSIAATFGELVVIAPSLPVQGSSPEQTLEEVSAARHGIELVPSIDGRCRCRDYWSRLRGRWLRDLRPLVVRADVVHAGLDDVYRPISYDAFREAVRHGKPTVFVQDTDIVVQLRELARGAAPMRRLEAWAYARIFERWCRRGIALADLSLVKGSRLLRRYADAGGNPKVIHDSSVREAEAIPEETLRRRLSTLVPGRPLRLVYCGRLVERKGVLESLALVEELTRQGHRLRFDLIGDGPLRSTVHHRVADHGLEEAVRLQGPLPYGPDLVRRLAEYDALLFTPLAEDTPRMIFDAYAAGLPLLAYDIPYLRERAAVDHATWLLPRFDRAAALERLGQILASRGALRTLSEAALRAAHVHSAERWYRRRALWTVRAVGRHRERQRALLPRGPDGTGGGR